MKYSDHAVLEGAKYYQNIISLRRYYCAYATDLTTGDRTTCGISGPRLDYMSVLRFGSDLYIMALSVSSYMKFLL